jgi:acetyl-CoA carboxylase biotin carboxyl carrier protein
MEYKQIQELIKTINKSNISELSIQDGEFQITIKQGGEAVNAVEGSHSMPMHMMLPMSGMQMSAMHSAPLPLAQPAHATAASPADAGGGSHSTSANGSAGQANGTPIKSPMIGTFYRSSSPDKPPFVTIGDEVKKGQVLCIIEAMKLFNEIESEVSGRIVKVLAEDASPVEYDQPLFLVEPI